MCVFGIIMIKEMTLFSCLTSVLMSTRVYLKDYTITNNT